MTNDTRKPREFWLNMYSGQPGGAWASKEEADKHRKPYADEKLHVIEYSAYEKALKAIEGYQRLTLDQELQIGSYADGYGARNLEHLNEVKLLKHQIETQAKTINELNPEKFMQLRSAFEAAKRINPATMEALRRVSKERDEYRVALEESRKLVDESWSGEYGVVYVRSKDGSPNAAVELLAELKALRNESDAFRKALEEFSELAQLDMPLVCENFKELLAKYPKKDV